MANWTVYILKCGDDTFYTGITNDLARRVSAHEVGAGAKYTKNRGPFEVVYTESAKDRSAASKRELEIKALNRGAKVELVAAHKTRQ